MKKILINALPKEVRIAILEDNELVEFYVERKGSRGIVGNIYKGKVLKILPAIQAAFIDIGNFKNAFLYVKDAVCWEFEEDVFDENGSQHHDIELPPIEEILSPGEEVIVQVSKEPLGTKGPRVTKNLTIPGHYLILIPTIKKIGISRRITDETERERLRKIGEKICPEEYGIIMRTAAEGAIKEEIEKDLKYLLKMWKNLEKKIEKKPPPILLYQDLEIVPKILRDILSEDVDEVLIDSLPEYRRALNFTKAFIPKLANKINFYNNEKQIFEKYQIEEAIQKALSRKVYLQKGGYIVIDETEALVSIDVNSGKFKKSNNLEETAFNVNCKAAKEIARQLRLRNIGGIIVIDFIDMQTEENKQELLKILERELLKDRAKTKIVSMSDLGLVEMTRKRVKKSLGRSLTTTCPYCEGKGRVKSPDTVAFEIERELLLTAKDNSKKKIKVYANPLVCEKLQIDEKDIIDRIETLYNLKIFVIPVEHTHIEKYTIVKSSQIKEV